MTTSVYEPSVGLHCIYSIDQVIVADMMISFQLKN